MPAAVFALIVSLLQLPSTKHLTVASSTSTNAAAPGSKVALYLDIVPRPGIHVYAPGAKDYLPIALKVDATSGLAVGALTYPKSQTMIFEGEKIPVYDKPFRLVQQVTLGRSLKAGEAVRLAGTLNYQACDDRVCFIPASVPVVWTITVL